MSIEDAYRSFLELTAGDAAAAAILAVGVCTKTQDDLLSVADVAGLLHLSDDRVRDFIRHGELRGHNLNEGGSRPHIVIQRSAVYEFLETLTVEPSRKVARKAKRYDPGDWAV